MIKDGALVIYKGKPAIVKDRADGKITITLQNNEQLKVRDKDILQLHPGPVKNFKDIDSSSIVSIKWSDEAVIEAWELLSDDAVSVSLKELASLICNEYTPASTFAIYSLLQDGLYFSGTIEAMIPRSKNEVESEEKKRSEKLRETDERSLFLEQIKIFLKKSGTNLIAPDCLAQQLRFFQDVEALALGKSVKSRTMKDLGISETPEDAHSLLLKTGFWTKETNPHPCRYGISQSSASICPDAPEHEERSDLCHLAAFAIDSPWSNDPDDAISIEKTPEESILYVHVADPAASISFDCPAEKEARERGVTLYLPENIIRMLSEETLELFKLKESEKSLTLTFKMTVDKSGTVTNTDIFPSIIKVRRITYEEADREMDSADTPDANVLRALYELSQRIYSRRCNQGAVNIELPDVHITVNNENVKIEPVLNYRSASMVRECMIAAGEGAGSWAASKDIPFPYISQDVEIQKAVPSGLAGSWQLRRGMRPRIFSTKPGCHQGLGLDIYTQVTSPLRRYTDLLAHLQLRAFLRGEPVLGIDEISARLGFSEAAAVAASQAERASNSHWIMVYLSDKKDSVWDAVTLENKGNRMQVIIPSLALETQVPVQKDVQPNENVKLVLKSVNIPRKEAIFNLSLI
ncbi:MAG: RNB domain-containing ribonuclease [Treponema sp.]|jgi:exoribonuclease-2|nr:RNB domain-containing ribonuclease [Treponema sp.]